VLLVGTTGQASLTPASDYDLLIVLTETVPLHVGATTIDGRMADLAFTTTEILDRLLAEPTEARGLPLAWTIARWLEDGQIAFDRQGRLGRGQALARSGALALRADEHVVYSIWFRANYNLLHNRRMLASSDPGYLQAFDLRLLYCLSDLVTAYFVVRRLDWDGDKAAIRYWQAHDPATLDRLQRAMAERDRTARLGLYEDLVARELAPVVDVVAREHRPGLPAGRALAGRTGG
jgi:hypothetical protein